jgi:hypothetical protein
MENFKETIITHADVKPEDKETPENGNMRKQYESYCGICDVYSPEEARALADELRRDRKNPNRKIMIGSMTHPLVLHPEREDPYDVRGVFVTRENRANGFIKDPDVLATAHYADLYGPNRGQDIFENLELVVKYGGENLNAIQIDVTWPDANEIIRFKNEHKDIVLILQVGKIAINEVDADPKKIVDGLRKYGRSIDYALIDMSMGKGEIMKAEKLLPILREIRKELPYLGLAVAGGLGPDPEHLTEFKPIAKEFPDISTDAQGNVKHKDAPRDSLGHLVSTHPADLWRSAEYVQNVCPLLDNPPEK